MVNNCLECRDLSFLPFVIKSNLEQLDEDRHIIKLLNKALESPRALDSNTIERIIYRYEKERQQTLGKLKMQIEAWEHCNLDNKHKDYVVTCKVQYDVLEELTHEILEICKHLQNRSVPK